MIYLNLDSISSCITISVPSNTGAGTLLTTPTLFAHLLYHESYYKTRFIITQTV